MRLGLASYKLRTGQADIPLEQLEMQSATIKKRQTPAVPVPARSGNIASVGWASSRLQSQLQQQRAQLAASTSSSSSVTSSRRPLPGAPVRRHSDDASLADASFSSQMRWS